jgi:hypothetical protein
VHNIILQKVFTNIGLRRSNWLHVRESLLTPVAQSVQCLSTDWKAGLRSPTEAEDFSSSLCVQTGSGAHPASCTVGTGGSLSGSKAGRGVILTTHPLPVPRLRKSRSCTSCHPNAPLWSVTGPLYHYLFIFYLVRGWKGNCIRIPRKTEDQTL